jgi:tripartite-type tricarboxylate transporter receptor subunit TctC
MLVPGKTPRDVVARLHQETVKAIQAPDVRDRMAKLGADPHILTPEQFDAFIRDEIVSNAALVKAAGIKTN